MLGALFDKKMNKIRLVDGKSAIWSGCVFAVFFFVIDSSYALGTSSATALDIYVGIFAAFDFGTTLINEGHGMHHHCLFPMRSAFTYGT